MGIQGLLPLLKDCQRVAHVKEYKGQTLAVDAYVWLHRGAYGCAQELATGQSTVKYVKYAMHRIRLLKYYGVTPYVVFDGGLLPSKMGTETDRESRRDEALRRASALVLEGKHAQAREFFVKAVDVTPQMAYQLIKALIAEGVSYVVAPYEADAQLAYLEKKGIVDGIITEDSDLLVFGCRKVLFKMDSEGSCVEICRDRFTACREFSFTGWTDKEFRQMAILSGCDYLDSISGLGIKTSHRLMRRYKSAEKVIRFVRLEGQLKVPRDYEKEFRRAELTFVHQRVFCPEEAKLVHLEPLPVNLQAGPAELSFVGPDMSVEMALGIARGDICPLSKTAMVDIAPDSQITTTKTASCMKASASTSSIKDFFKPLPAAVPKSKKRQILGEVRGNNLFANKGDVETKAGPPIKSRFFVAPSKSANSASKVSIIVSSDEDEMGGNEQEGNATDSLPELDGTEADEDAEVYRLAEQMTQAADAACSGGDYAEEVDQEAEELARQLDIEMWAAEERVASSAENGELAKTSPDEGGNFSLPPRPLTPQREPPSDTGYSHISTPGNTAKRSSSKRTRSVANVKGENDENMDNPALLSSPGFSFLTSPVSQSLAKKTKQEPSSSLPIDLTNVPSPSPSPATRKRKQDCSHKEVKQELPDSPINPRAVKRNRADTIDSHWSSEAVTPSEGDNASLCEARPIKAGKCSTSIVSSKGKGRITESEAQEQNQRSEELFERVKQAQRNRPILKRCNDTLGGLPFQCSTRKKSSSSSELEEEADERDAKTENLLASWRSQFSFAKDKASKVRSGSTLAPLTNRAPPASVFGHKRQSATPLSSSKKKQQSSRSKSASKPIGKATSYTEVAIISPEQIDSESETENPRRKSRSTSKLIEGASLVSPTSSSKLSAFRYSRTPSSSQSASSVTSAR